MDFPFFLAIAIGFLAQIVDGALGMAFGVIAVVTTAVSAGSHVWNKNFDRRLFLRLVITGVCGGVLGAYILTGLPEHVIKPLVALYLSAMSLLIFLRVLGYALDRWRPPVPMVGFGGGFLDAVGGGGWGPLVASTLLAAGGNPRRTVGSANAAEFFVTVSISITFLAQLEMAQYGKLVLGLVIGGAVAAPLAGYLLRIMSIRVALTLIGVVLAGLSIVNFANVLAQWSG
jgi:uncharacterized membrane protein YfcA